MEPSASIRADQNQHYVPQTLLRHFSVPLKRKQIIVFDKQEERTFSTNIRNVSSEKAFYNIDVGDQSLTMEGSLRSVEDSTAKINSTVIETEQLPKAESIERLLLSIFVAVQFLRVKNLRTTITATNDLLKQKLQSIGTAEADIERLTTMGEEDAKIVSMRMLEQTSQFVPLFYYKPWILLKTTKGNPFFISDNPVTLQNERDFGLCGNLGLGVEGIEIYMPLSSQLSLGILCPIHEKEIISLHEQFSDVRQRRPEIVEQLGERAAWCDNLRSGIGTGAAIPTPPEVVLNLNSLQVYFSSRFVYCTNDSFDLVREMIRKNPRVKAGPPLPQLVN